MNDELTHVDLFSGIGGFALAAQRCGIQTTVFCERDEYCQRVLQKHWPTVPCVPDIHAFNGVQHYGAFLLTGGFPCQPFSLAGKRRGKEDDRAIWPQMFRVITEGRPHWVIAENVPGLITMELDSVLSDLESIGYETQTIVIPACAVDARHRRDRVWIVAHHTSIEVHQRKCGDLAEAPRGREGFDSASESGCQNVANPKSAGLEGAKPTRNTRPDGCSPERGQVVADSDGQRGCVWSTDRKDAGDVGRSPCTWKDEGEWFSESGMGRVDHGIPHRVDRLKGLGNAIVPQVAEELMRMIIEVEKQTP